MNPSNESLPSPAASRPFGTLPDGTAATLYTLGAAGGLRVAITDYGGAVVSLWVPGRDGRFADVVLGYDDADGYRSGKSYFGAIIGRFGNRIAHGRFTLNGVRYALPINNGPNHLHGGPNGFHRHLWRAEPASDGRSLRLSRTSPDGEEGYPGNLQADVVYEIVGSDALRIRYRAVTDRPTVVNLTNHAYFNLAGHAAGDILDQRLTVFADHYTPVDSGLIPTGAIASVAGTPFGFTRGRRIGERIDSDDAQLHAAGGYDHNFVLRQGAPGSVELAARVVDEGSGRTMDVLTTEPGMQFYSGNFLDGTERGKGGAVYAYRTGFCLETQHYPDSPNHPAFPSVTLNPGDAYESVTEYRFGVV